MEENNQNQSPYGQLLGVFDYHTSKREMETGIDKCREYFYRSNIFNKIAGWLIVIVFFSFIGWVAVGQSAMEKTINMTQKNIILLGLIPGIFFALLVVFGIIGSIKLRVLKLQFKVYRDRQLEYAPPTPFILRVFIYETGVYFAATEKFNGYMPYAGNFKYHEQNHIFLLGSVETKIFLGIYKSDLTPEAMRIVRFASDYNTKLD
jgi:amino acid transporter